MIFTAYDGGGEAVEEVEDEDEDEDEDDKVRLVQRHTTPYAPSPREPSTWYLSRLCSSYNTS